MTEKHLMDAALGWELYKRQHPNLKGLQKIQAEKAFYAAAGILLSIKLHKRKQLMNKLKFWRRQ